MQVAASVVWGSRVYRLQIGGLELELAAQQAAAGWGASLHRTRACAVCCAPGCLSLVGQHASNRLSGVFVPRRAAAVHGRRLARVQSAH